MSVKIRSQNISVNLSLYLYESNAMYYTLSEYSPNVLCIFKSPTACGHLDWGTPCHVTKKSQWWISACSFTYLSSSSAEKGVWMKGGEHIKYHFLLFITWHPERLATLKFIQGRSKCADELKLSYLDASDASGQQLPSAEKTMLALNFLKVSMIWSAPELMRTSWASVNRIILFVSSTCRFNSSFNKLTLVPNPSNLTPKPSILKGNPFTSADRWNLFTGLKKFVARVTSKSLLSSSKKSISFFVSTWIEILPEISLFSMK